MRRALTTAAAAVSLAVSSPAQVDENITVPTSLLFSIGDVLPEGSNAGAAYLSDLFDPTIIVDANCTIKVLFLWEGAGYWNTLGYFTFTEDGEGAITIVDSNLIFPNASFPSAGSMQIGDAATLKDPDTGLDRTFVPGEKVGFFVVANGFRSYAPIPLWNPSVDSGSIPHDNGTDNGGVGLGCYTSIPRINREWDLGKPSLARHLALIRFQGISGFLDGDDFLVGGFEDLNRTRNSDDDFNDVVFIAHADPEAIDETEVYTYVPGDPDGDGVFGTNDHYPNDASRAVVSQSPSQGNGMIFFEDKYPEVGDGDFNDCAIAYNFFSVTRADGRVKDLMGTFHLCGRGATYQHHLGLYLGGLAAGNSGTVDIERFYSDDEETHETVLARALTEDAHADGGYAIVDLFGTGSRDLLPGVDGSQLCNTESDDRNAASVRVHITFDPPVLAANLGTAPYGLFFEIERFGNERWDVHFPGATGFSDRPGHLPAELGALSFVDDNGFPWLLEIPQEAQFPMERDFIEDVYSGFAGWRNSSGVGNRRWYTNPTGAAADLSQQISAYLVPRSWTVKLPDP